MKKKDKKFYHKKWVRFFLIPFLLLIVWGVLTLWYVILQDESFTVAPSFHNAKNFTVLTNSKLLKHDKVAGEFTAQDNNLGIISIRFQTFIRVPYSDEDTLEFRLKEHGAKNWYYQNSYQSGLIYDVPLFPFGFPKIPDSKGRKYDFEIESLKGNDKNAVAISTREPVLISKYQTPKTYLLQNKSRLLFFTFKKFLIGFYSPYVDYSSFVFLLPFIFYILLLSPVGNGILLRLRETKLIAVLLQNVDKFKKNASYPFVVFMIGLVLVDVFYFQLVSSFLYIVLIIIWLFVAIILRQKSRVTFNVGLFLLCFGPFLLYLQREILAEQMVAWAFMFFVIGVVQSLIELRYNIY